MNCSTAGFLALRYLLQFYSNLCPLSWWCHLIIWSSVASLSSCPHFSQQQNLFWWVSSCLQVAVLELQLQHQSFQNEHSRLISFWIGWYDLVVQETLKSLLQHHNLKASIPWLSAFFMVQLSYPYMTTGKNHSFDYGPLSAKWCLIFNMLSRLARAFFPRSKHLLISWLKSPSSVILEHKKIKSVTVFILFQIYLPWSDGNRWHDLCFVILSFKWAFSLSSFTFIKRLFSSSLLSALRLVSSAYLRLLIFSPAILIPACDSSRPHFAYCTLCI